MGDADGQSTRSKMLRSFVPAGKTQLWLSAGSFLRQMYQAAAIELTMKKADL